MTPAEIVQKLAAGGSTSPKVAAGGNASLGATAVVGALLMVARQFWPWVEHIDVAVAGPVGVALLALVAKYGSHAGAFFANLLPGKTTAEVEALIRAAQGTPEYQAAIGKLAQDVQDMLERSGRTLESANGAVQLATKTLVSTGSAATFRDEPAVLATDQLARAAQIAGDGLTISG